jgi:hypothetical protein
MPQLKTHLDFHHTLYGGTVIILFRFCVLRNISHQFSKWVYILGLSLPMKQIFRHKPPQQASRSLVYIIYIHLFSIDILVKLEFPKNDSGPNSNITALLFFL